MLASCCLSIVTCSLFAQIRANLGPSKGYFSCKETTKHLILKLMIIAEDNADNVLSINK